MHYEQIQQLKTSLFRTTVYPPCVPASLALVDIDGVILDNSHRLHHITHNVDGVHTPKSPPDWKAWFAAACHDVAGAYCSLVRSLCASHNIVFLTARREFDADTRTSLLFQLSCALDYQVKSEFLFMREAEPRSDGEGGKESTDAFKKRVAQAIQSDKAFFHVALAIDDSHKNCVAFQELNIPVLRAYSHLTPEMYHSY